MKKKILSLLTAFAMVFGILVAPFTSAKAADNKAGTLVAGTSDKESTTTITLHKLKLTSLSNVPTQKAKEDFIEGLKGNPKEKYVGGKINNIQDFFDDKKADELAGVKFTYWVFNDRAKYEEMIKDSSKYDTEAKVDAYLNGAKDFKKDYHVSKKGGAELTKITVPANENRFLWVVETSSVIPGDSTAQKEEEKTDRTITGMKAIPFGLALPLFNAADSSVKTDIHVYPKNTTANEPKVDKDFKGKADANNERKEADNGISKDVTVGEKVDYEIETIIPVGSKYKTAVWTDQMTEGLTFDETSLKVYTGAKGNEQVFPASNYTVKKEGNGFTLKLEEAGLAAINGKDAEVRLRVEYSATVNDKAKVERPERNDVIFHYGNDPKHGNTPEPNKPNDSGDFKVTKKWATGTTLPKDGIDVTFTLYNANTGKVVTKDDLVEPADTNAKSAYNTYKENFANPITKKATSTSDITYEWKYLDKDYQYVAKETFNGYAATYTKGQAGEVTVENTKTDNPGPKDPQEPGVKTYGHRFQKVDKSDNKGLAGAKFVVKNNIDKVKADSKDNEGVANTNKGKFLAQKTAKDMEADQKKYADAEQAYKAAVKASKEDSEIAKLKATRDAAYVAVNTEWKWVDAQGEAYVFTSNTDGYFKVTGLMAGAYQLIETKAPEGYAENKEPIDFTVGEGSAGKTELKVDKLEDKTGFKQIDNKKITIPQTGGIGSLIFIVAGLAIMTGAFVAYKRSQAVEA